MATRRQRQRKLARAQFHSAQCKDRNRSGRRFVKTYDEPVHERRSAVIIMSEAPSRRMELESMTREALRGLAATHNIRGRSIMTKAALINAIVEHS
jgi:hypothetical protein